MCCCGREAGTHAVSAGGSRQRRVGGRDVAVLAGGAGLVAAGCGPPWSRGRPTGLGPHCQACRCGGAAHQPCFQLCARLLLRSARWAGRQDWLPPLCSTAALAPLAGPRTWDAGQGSCHCSSVRHPPPTPGLSGMPRPRCQRPDLIHWSLGVQGLSKWQLFWHVLHLLWGPQQRGG